MQFPTILVPREQLTHEQLQKYVRFSSLEHNPDLLEVTPLEGKSSISIDQVHELQGQLVYKPIQEKYKVAIIARAHLLTLPAQQALLKTLEEPPENTQIMLVTGFPHKLLPTILSRATILGREREEKHPKSTTPNEYEGLQTQNIIACLKLSDEWSKSKDDAIESLRSLVEEVQHRSHREPSQRILRDEKAIVMCIEQLEKNVNAKLALDHLFFILSGYQG